MKILYINNTGRPDPLESTLKNESGERPSIITRLSGKDDFHKLLKEKTFDCIIYACADPGGSLLETTQSLSGISALIVLADELSGYASLILEAGADECETIKGITRKRISDLVDTAIARQGIRRKASFGTRMFLSIFGTIPYPLIFIGPGYRILEYNIAARDWALKIYGNKLRRGSSIFRFITDDYSGTIDACLSSGGINRSTEIDVVEDINGTEFWFEYEFFHVTGLDANNYVWISIRDVSERKFAIDQVAQTERKFSSLVRGSSDIIAVIDSLGVIEFISDSSKNILGYSPFELEGRPVFDLVHDRDSAAFRAIFEKRKQVPGSVFIAEYQFRHSDRHWVYLEFSVTNLLDDHNISGIVLNARDTTYRKEIEAALNKINRQRELILESTGDGIYGVDINRRITFVNPAAARLIKIDEKDIIGEYDYTVFPQVTRHGTEYPENENPLRATLADGTRHRNSDIFFKRKDGSVIPVECIVSPIFDNETITGAVVSFNDISSRHLAQAALEKARDDAEKATRAKSEFLATMSHEIRTPLNSIMGFIELLSRSRLDPDQGEYVEIIRESSGNLLALINDILDFSKIEKGKLDLEIIEFDPVIEFNSTVSLFSTRAGENNLDYTVFIDPSLPQAVHGDPLKINQVLINLIGNAIKFTPDGGSIHVDISVTGRDDRVAGIRFSVTDTGIGIPEKKQKQIFEAFTQADSSISRKFGGTGLGLAISSNLIELMGGRLTFESEEGSGSTFSFSLVLEEVKGKPESRNMGIDVPVLYLSSETEERNTRLENWFCMSGLDIRINPPATDLKQLSPGIIFMDHIPGPEDLSALNHFSLDIPRVLITRYRHDIDFDKKKKYFDKILFTPVTALKLAGTAHELLFPSTGRPGEEEVAGTRFEGTVLVAEDDKNSSRLISIMLSSIGLDSETAGTGLEVIDRFSPGRYTAVLMDINMPQCDGIEASRRIRELEEKEGAPRIPIIALTANVMNDESDKYRAAGMDDHLTKPISLDRLVAALKKHLPFSRSSELPQKSAENKTSLPSLEQTSSELGLPVETVRELLHDFLESIEEYIAPLETAVHRGDTSVIRACAHKLKGSAAIYGFNSLSSVLGEMEDSAEKDIDTDYASMLENVMFQVRGMKDFA